MAHARRSSILVFVGLVASWSPLPQNAVAVVPLVWAGVESVRAIREIRAIQAIPNQSAEPARKRGMASSVVGLVLVGVLTALVLLPYAVYGKAKSLQDCMGGANTAIAAAECNSEVKSDLKPFLGGFLDDSR